MGARRDAPFARARPKGTPRRGLSARGDGTGVWTTTTTTTTTRRRPLDSSGGRRRRGRCLLCAIDRVRLVATRSADCVAGSGSRSGGGGERARPLRVRRRPGCRERVFCCAGGAVYAATLTWLAQVEGAWTRTTRTGRLLTRAADTENESGSRLPRPRSSRCSTPPTRCWASRRWAIRPRGLVLAVTGNAGAAPGAALPPEREDPPTRPPRRRPRASPPPRRRRRAESSV